MKELFNCNRLLLCTILTLGISYFVSSQNKSEFSISNIQKLIDSDSLDKADRELKIQTDFYINSKQYDSLSNLTYFYGKIAQLKGESNYLEKSKTALERLKNLTNNPDALYNAYSDMASLTVEAQLFKESYDYNKLGLIAAQNTTVDKLNKMSHRTYGMASTAYFMRKLDLVKKHGIEAFKINENNPDASATNIYNAGNIVGLMMQNENKLDSALFYYNKGAKALEDAEGSLSERYYFPAILSGNIAIIYMNQGKFNQSLKNQQKAINNYRIFIDSSAHHPRINNIRYNYLSTINDMGSNYVKLGQVERSLQLFEYNYKKAKQYFPENSIQQLIFTNQLAQGKWVANESEEALDLINEAYEKFKNLSNDYAGYMTYGIGTKANILENFGRINEAYNAYKQSDSLYEIVSPGNYNFDRLSKLREAAMFYSRNGFKKDADEASQKVLNVARATEINENLETIKAYSLLAAIKLNLKNYQKSIEWAEKSLNVIEKNKALISVDSTLWNQLKIEASFYKSKSEFNIIDTTDVASISKIHEALKQSINALNTNASKYSSDTDKNEYIYKTKSLLDFSMQISLKLYNLTNEKNYLDQIISIHESRIYNRIRSKLGTRGDMKFNDVPKNILDKEKQLKDDLAALRSKTDFEEKAIQNFTKKNKEWTDFLDSLKINQPKYYKLRYETIKKSLGNIQNNIPSNTTVIRYFFIDEQLYTFIVDSASNSLHKLNSKDLSNNIELLSGDILDEEKIKTTLYQLYDQLWRPFASKVQTKKVIIIPDQELFNLSFEALTSKKINSYKDLAKNSLISKYIISYNYSLYLLENDKKILNYDKDFIAFAPEFNDNMKKSYSVAIADSINLDKTYLKLLPQPFTVELAKEYSRLFNGNFFTNESASKQVFTEQAKEHKIIHIGTHAESNNISPELSRLIFAKTINNDSISDDNSLYTYEIYNQNLASNLAILTACETGKPSYQPGEGMISLAHAFNYAGSESILTSLWKIDEQSSAEILKHFYDNLSEGLTKDEALRQAKLTYLSNADGRTLSPQYWAGLVLIGETAPIDINTSSNLIFWLLGILVLIIIGVFIKRKGII